MLRTAFFRRFVAALAEVTPVQFRGFDHSIRSKELLMHFAVAIRP